MSYSESPPILVPSTDEAQPLLPRRMLKPGGKTVVVPPSIWQNFDDIFKIPLKNVRPSRTVRTARKRIRERIFVCSLRPVSCLKLAIEALSDPEVNSRELGRIDVDYKGFNITVENPSNSFVGHLHLNPPDTFQCSVPLTGMKLSCLELSRELADTEDEGSVYFANRVGSDQLEFRIIGDEAIREFSIELCANSGEIRKYQETSLLYVATVTSDDLMQMVELLLQQEQEPPLQVSVLINEDTATLSVGSDQNSWNAKYLILGDTGSRAMEAGERYNASFQWTNRTTLQKAIDLDAKLLMLFDAEPPKNIILRFVFEDVGYLEYMTSIP